MGGVYYNWERLVKAALRHDRHGAVRSGISGGVFNNWQRLVQAALRRDDWQGLLGGRGGQERRETSSGLASGSEVPDSLKSSTNINAILEAADDIQDENPTVARILCEQAYAMAQDLDPRSDGRGVLQFKTGLMSLIKQKHSRSGGQLIDRGRDVEYLWEFYQQYKRRHRVDDIQKQEQKWHESRQFGTTLRDSGFSYSEMRKVHATFRALVEVMEAMSKHVASEEIGRLIVEELRRVKRSNAILSAGLMPYNIIPVDAPSLTSSLGSFPEVKAAVSAIRYPEDFPRLPAVFEISALRDAYVFDLLEYVFGFQKDNIRNQREHVVLTIANAQSQLGIPTEAEPKISERAITEVFLKVMDNYIKWCRYLRISPAFDSSIEAITSGRKLFLLSLYLCIWGEAANVRFLPECICYIFHHMAKEIDLMLNHGEVTPAKSCVAENGSVSFLEQVIHPIYEAIAAEAAVNLSRKAAHSEWRNYDDFNEYFWSSSCFELSWPLKKDSSFLMKPRNKRKTGKSIFVEHRTFVHLYRSFHRLWIFLIVTFQALAIVAFNKEKDRLSTFKLMLSVGPTWAFMNFVKSTLDVLLTFGAYSTAGAMTISRLVTRVSVSGLSLIFVTYLYVRVLQERNKGSGSFFFKFYMFSLGIYTTLRVVIALLLKFPAFHSVSEKYDGSFFRFFKLIYQERYYVGRGLVEKVGDYIRYVIFWLVVLASKFSFAYYFMIEPLAKSTKVIVDLRGLQYSWHSFISKRNHNFFSVVSLWGPVVAIYLMDIHIWYTVWSAVVGGVMGAKARLGEIRSVEMLRKRFKTFPEGFFKNLVSSQTKRIPFGEQSLHISHDNKKLYASIFSPFWNEIIKCLREEDYISDREMEFLLMPSNNGSLSLAQWPLFLINNKILLAIDFAQNCKDNQEYLWGRISKDEYMAYGVQDCYASIEKVLHYLADGEDRFLVVKIFREINSSILEGSLAITLSLKNLTVVLSRFTALTGLLIQDETDELASGAAKAMYKFYETVVHDFLSSDQREQHDMWTSLVSGRNDKRLFSKIQWPKDPEIKELVKRMYLLLSVKDSAATVPKNIEARRRLEFFTNSLFMHVPQAAPVCEMIPFSVFTPYYKETVLYSISELLKENEDGVSVLFYLKKIFPDEWNNFRERILQETIGGWDNLMERIRFWASYRGQTLARTVRGMMYYRKALLLQSYLEMRPIGENVYSQINFPATQGFESSRVARAQADLKFTYVVSCQIYGQQKKENSPQAADISLLLRRNEALRVAFIHEEERVTSERKVLKEYYSKLVKAGEHGKDQEIYSIKLPGNPILGEGKPENQNHAIIFTRGDAIQTIDMNQDNYLEEAMKMRNLLEEFRGNHGLRRPTILGVREHVFTGSVSSLASFMSNQEGSFVTLGQRVLAEPLKVRMHYGHPDVFDRIFHITRGGVSKASRVINISEDIFAGFNSTLRQGNITHHEYIQVGKGRDVGLNQIALFEGKVAGGNGEQVLSRDVYRLGQLFDFFRMLSFYFTTVGYYVCTMLTVLTVYIFLYGRVYLALSGLDEGISKAAHSLGNKALNAVLNTQFLVQIGVFTAVPMIICFILDLGLLKAVSSFIVMQLQLCSVFFTFSLLTRTHYFGRTILHGGAKYQETGRGFVIQHIKFADNYRLYSRSHFVKALEVAWLLIVYSVYGYRKGNSFTYLLAMIFSWFPVISWLFAPFIFNPSGFEWQKTVEDFDDWINWLWYRGGIGIKGTKSWESWWNEEQMHIRTLRGRILETILTLRFFMFQYGIVYKLNLTGDQRSLKVYGFSWIILVGVAMVFKVFTLSPKRSGSLPMALRLLQGVTAFVLALTLALLIKFTKLTSVDLFASVLALAPTGWAILCLAVTWKHFVWRLGVWDWVKEFARLYDGAMGMVIFIPVALISWFPFVAAFQSRMLFNQALSRGLEISLILAGNKANAQVSLPYNHRG